MLYILFTVVIIIMLLLDLGVFNKKSHEISTKEACIWTIVWITLSMLFSLFIYWQYGTDRFIKFQSAYWIEKALSVDNLFVFILVFSYFNVKSKNQHKVLFWGILGAIIMRAIFIFSGTKFIAASYLPETSVFGRSIQINVLLLVFGIFLLYAGIKSAVNQEDDENKTKDFNRSPGAKFVKFLFPRVTQEFHGSKFFVRKPIVTWGDKELRDGNRIVQKSTGLKKVLYATPLLVVVGVIEFTDLLFAVDSIPAIFAIAPDDPFILYSSNIFAILGLRAMYFLLANFIHMFRFLKYGLSFILSFIGIKMIIGPIYHISSVLSLSIIVGVLILSVVLSLIIKQKQK